MSLTEGCFLENYSISILWFRNVYHEPLHFKSACQSVVHSAVCPFVLEESPKFPKPP